MNPSSWGLMDPSPLKELKSMLTVVTAGTQGHCVSNSALIMLQDSQEGDCNGYAPYLRADPNMLPGCVEVFLSYCNRLQHPAKILSCFVLYHCVTIVSYHCVTIDSLTDSVTDSVSYPYFLHLYHVFIPPCFHRFRIKSLMQFHTLQKLTHTLEGRHYSACSDACVGIFHGRRLYAFCLSRFEMPNFCTMKTLVNLIFGSVNGPFASHLDTNLNPHTYHNSPL